MGFIPIPKFTQYLQETIDFLQKHVWRETYSQKRAIGCRRCKNQIQLLSVLLFLFDFLISFSQGAVMNVISNTLTRIPKKIPFSQKKDNFCCIWVLSLRHYHSSSILISIHQDWYHVQNILLNYGIAKEKNHQHKEKSRYFHFRWNRREMLCNLSFHFC